MPIIYNDMNCHYNHDIIIILSHINILLSSIIIGHTQYLVMMTKIGCHCRLMEPPQFSMHLNTSNLLEKQVYKNIK